MCVSQDSSFSSRSSVGGLSRGPTVGLQFCDHEEPFLFSNGQRHLLVFVHEVTFSLNRYG